jgi:hypothetical protein
VQGNGQCMFMIIVVKQSIIIKSYYAAKIRIIMFILHRDTKNYATYVVAHSSKIW